MEPFRRALLQSRVSLRLVKAVAGCSATHQRCIHVPGQRQRCDELEGLHHNHHYWKLMRPLHTSSAAWINEKSSSNTNTSAVDGADKKLGSGQQSRDTANGDLTTGKSSTATTPTTASSGSDQPKLSVRELLENTQCHGCGVMLQTTDPSKRGVCTCVCCVCVCVVCATQTL